MTQNQRDKTAIITILRQMGDATYPDIALRGGEGLASPLIEMVQAGEVIREHDASRPAHQQTRYRLNG
jgi:hypothetical protein